MDDESGWIVERFDLVTDGCHRALGKGHQPHGGQPYRLASRRYPLRTPLQRACPHIQDAFVLAEIAIAQIERLIVDQEADQLPVGDIDDGLARLRVAVAGFDIR